MIVLRNLDVIRKYGFSEAPDRSSDRHTVNILVESMPHGSTWVYFCLHHTAILDTGKNCITSFSPCSESSNVAGTDFASDRFGVSSHSIALLSSPNTSIALLRARLSLCALINEPSPIFAVIHFPPLNQH